MQRVAGWEALASALRGGDSLWPPGPMHLLKQGDTSQRPRDPALLSAFARCQGPFWSVPKDDLQLSRA